MSEFYLQVSVNIALETGPYDEIYDHVSSALNITPPLTFPFLEWALYPLFKSKQSLVSSVFVSINISTLFFPI